MKYARDFATFVIVSLSAYILWLPTFSLGQFYVFQARDLERAQAVANGINVFFGPETSGGGTLPGGFFYYLMAIPLKLGCGWQGVWVLKQILFAFSMGLLCTYLTRRFSQWAGLTSVALIVCSSYLIRTVSTFVNPQFMPIFVIIAVISLVEAFAVKSKQKTIIWCIGGLAMGLGIQLHFTMVCLLVSGLVLQMLAPRIGLVRLKAAEFIFGLVAFLIPILPFIIWQLGPFFHADFGLRPFVFSGTSDHSLWFLWQHNYRPLKVLWQNAPLPHGAVFLLPESASFGAFCAYLFICRYFRQPAPVSAERVSLGAALDRAAKVVATCTLVTFCLCAYFFLLADAVRFILVFLICLSVLIGLYTARAISSSPLKLTDYIAFAVLGVASVGLSFETAARFSPIYFFGGGLLLLLITLAAIYAPLQQRGFRHAAAAVIVMALVVFKTTSAFSILKTADLVLNIGESQEVANYIVSQTGWHYETARDHIFYVNVLSELTMDWIFRSANPTQAQPKINVSGFFVGLLNADDCKKADINSATWLKENHIEGSMIQLIEDQEMILLPPFRHDRILVIPYTMKSELASGDFYQNLGYPYAIRPKLATPPLKKAGAYSAAFFDCAKGRNLCEVDVTVTRAKVADRDILEIEIDSAGLAQPSELITPNWTQALIEPKLIIECANTRTEIALAQSVGFWSNDQFTLNHSLLAPYKRHFADPCAKHDQVKMQFSYGSSRVTTWSKDLFLPARTVELLSQAK